ncbi:MAG: helix-turn-helix domain-containing protein [Turneriella sp.]
MSISSSLTLVLVFNLPLVAMIGIALVRLGDRSTRLLFTGLGLALMLWATPLILVRADFLQADTIALASRLTFSGGVLSVTLLYLFFQRFAEMPRGKMFYVVLANGAFTLLATLFGFVEEGVRPVPGGFAPNHGVLHRYYVVSQSATVLYTFFAAFLAYRRSESALLRFQLRSIGGFGFVAFLFPIINNGLMPVLVKEYPFPAFGVIGILLFQFGIFNMLVRGQWLFIRNIFGRLHQSTAWQRRENIISLSRLVELLNSIVGGNVRNFKDAFGFVTDHGEALHLHAKSEESAGGYATPARFNEQILPKWNQGLVDNLVRLEADNKRLALYLTKAESLVADKWLSSAVKTLERPKELELPLLPIDLYASEHAGLVDDFRALFGHEMLICSTELFTVVESLKRLKDSQLPVVFDGDTGVGKSTLAHALHYLRSKAEPLVLECSYQTRHLAARLERLKRTAPSGAMQGIVVKNLDAVRPEELAQFVTWLMGNRSLPYLYLTVKSAESLGAKLAEPGQRAYCEALPQLSISPLSSRPDDLRAQIFFFAERLSRERGLSFTGIAKDFLAAAQKYAWPGNTAELKARLEQALLMQTRGATLDAGYLNLREAPRAIEGPKLSALERAERDVIWECLQRRRFNQRQTAIELEITINTLRAKMEKYGLQIPEQK